MANLPPSPFQFAASDAAAEQAAVSLLQPPRGTAADHSDSGTTDCLSEQAATSPRQSADVAADLSVSPGGHPSSLPDNGESEPSVMLAYPPGENHIGEIFVGAAKLGYVPHDFDPAAITSADQLLFDVLSAMVDPRVPGLREIPDEQALFDAIEPMPLFLQAVGY